MPFWKRAPSFSNTDSAAESERRQAGVSFSGMEVATPDGFKAAYQRLYREGGWCSLAVDPRWGGQGCRGHQLHAGGDAHLHNVSFSLYPGLTRGAISAISNHASRWN